MLKGLSQKEAEENIRKFGKNVLTEIPPDPLWKKILEGFKDPMLVILCVALTVQIILFCFGQAQWFEPVGIFIAIIIANTVAAISENQQEGKASVLKAEEQSKEKTKVIREGKLTEINFSEITVGDTVFLQAGDKIPADGTVIDGTIMADQAALNGETEEALKTVNENNEEYDRKDLLNKFFVYRGCVVCSGEAYIKIETIGDKTLFGQLALEVQEETRETPLQVKLGKLAQEISVFGYIGASLIIIAVILKAILGQEFEHDFVNWIRLVIDAITVAVTIIVCAVPEGLPMLTSILMSFQSLRMIKDNVLVRKINGLETCGSISILFSDKTGTITEGKLSITEIVTGEINKITSLNSLKIKEDIKKGIGLNNSAKESDGKIFGGNSTDRALMKYLISQNETDNLNKYIVKEFQAFDSNKKYSAITVSENNKTATYIKGAPEKIIEKCSEFIDEKGDIKELKNKTDINNYINAQAQRSMRLLAVAKYIGEENNNWILVCIISIRDKVRIEAIDAINEVQNAGIQVVMVTGDRKETAEAIAKESGLIKKDTDIVLTSGELNALSDEEVKNILPKLRVVSRALPTDKSRLVRLAQELDLVVGMTGDGVNDSPALKKADVGFAMGSGTEVAKEAGDITILDDNFLSIEKAILYGRTMFKSIRKFLIFQLTVNVAAVLICFIAPLLGLPVILTVIQLLLINLAMDTLAAIAFGSEPALKEFMKEKPIPRNEHIISKKMYSQIFVASLYITFICLGIVFIPFIRNMLHTSSAIYLTSSVFATFMMAITFNGFNARCEKLNIFDKIGKNINFWIIMILIFVIQFFFVTFGGEPLNVTKLLFSDWIICIGLAVFVIPLDILRKIIYKSFSKI